MTKILFEDVVLKKSPERAMRSLLKLSGLQRYVASLGSDREKQDFTRHMQKYINIWLPDCPFEVSFTNRYMVDQWEARTTARKYVKTGDKIKYLCGNLVSITMDEEEDQSFISNAFSITYSSRKKTPSLFLGPARFANHDCNANAKLESRGGEGMVVIAVREIEEGDEITVNYGENYFGENNCECLCHSCEKKVCGGWRHGTKENNGTQTPRAGSESDGEGPGSRRSKRRRQPIDYTQRLREPKTYTEEEPQPKRRKSDLDLASISSAMHSKVEPRKMASSHLAKAASQRPERRKEDVDPRTAAMRAQIGKDFLQTRASSSRTESRHPSAQAAHSQIRRSSTPMGRRSFRSSVSSNRTRKTGKDAIYKSHMLFAFLKRGSSGAYKDPKSQASPPRSELIVPSIELEEPRSQLSSSSSDENSIFDRAERPSASPFTDPSASDSRVDNGERAVGSPAENFSTKEAIPSSKRTTEIERPPPTISPGAEQAEPSDPATSHDPPATNLAECKSISPEDSNKRTENIRNTAQTSTVEGFFDLTTAQEPKIVSPDEENEESESETEYRVPGDYVRTERLLGPKNSRWVECRTCGENFVQHEANQIRRECPRCERHSKLYGFQWPQTDYQHGGPERVMDHRTVNRFLSRAEEMEEPKHRGRRGG